LEKHTEEDPDLRLHYFEWMRTPKPKQQIHVQRPLRWLDQVAKADFSNPRLAIDFRRSLFSKEVDYLEIACDRDSREIFLVLPDPGALPIYGYPIVELPEMSIADEGLQMHPAFLSLSILGDYSTDPKVRIPKLVLPVGRLVSVEIGIIKHLIMQNPELWPHRLPSFREENLATRDVTDNFEEFRRELWKHVKESKAMKDTDYFVVIDVVTPGYPVWIIYNPDREEDSEDLTAADLLQSTSKFPRLDSESGFGAAQILTGIKNWISPHVERRPQFWPYEPLWPGYFVQRLIFDLKTIDEIETNISRTRIPYPVVGRLENMKIAQQVFIQSTG
jgi:hypothetical protein